MNFLKKLNLRIRYKLILYYSICFAIVFISGAVLIYHQVATTMEANLKLELETTNAMILQLVKNAVDISIKNHLRAVAENDRNLINHIHQKELKKNINNAMAEKQARENAIDLLFAQTIGNTGYVYVINLKGEVIAHPQEELVGQTVTNFPFINEMIKKKSGYMCYEWKNPSEKRPHTKVMYFVYFEPWNWIIAVTSYRSEFMDLFDVEDVKDSIYSINPELHCYSAIMDIKGNLVVHPFMKGNIFDDTDNNKVRFAREIIAKKTGIMKYLWQNPGETIPHKRIARIDFIPDYNWVMVSTVYVDDFFKPLTAIRSTIIFISIAIILVIVAVSIVLGLEMTRSIELLTKKMESYTKGAFKGVHDKHRDEIAMLSANVKLFMTHLSQERENRQKAEERFRAIFNSSFSFIGLLDLEGNLMEVNQTALSFVNATPLDVIGKPFWETPWWTSDQSKKKLRQEIEQCAKGKFIRSEVENLSSSGKKISIDYSLKTVVDETHTPVAIVAEGRDFTERKIAEERLKQANTELKQTKKHMIQSEKMLSVGGLAAGMAHEINNPLAGIMQNLQVLVSRLKDPLPVNIQTAIECGITLDAINLYMEKRKIFSIAQSALTGGTRAAKIVENMLSFSRKGDGVISGHNLAEIMDSTLEIAENDYGLKKKYDFRSIIIQRNYEPDLPLVPCEQSTIKQVFFNIIKNGTQAMTKQKLPENRRPCFNIRIFKDENHACIKIKDNGPGMTKEVSQRIFEPFYTTKDVWEGTGLGLSVSYFIITENNQGTIEVDSVLGEGTCFTIKLPFKRKSFIPPVPEH